MTRAMLNCPAPQRDITQLNDIKRTTFDAAPKATDYDVAAPATQYCLHEGKAIRNADDYG